MIFGSSLAHIFTLKPSSPLQVMEQGQSLLLPPPSICSQSQLLQRHRSFILVMPFILEWSINQLSTRLHQPDNLFLYRISHITFTQLKTIDISCNNIESIEPLAYLDCRKLVFLSLSNNNITCLKPLAKCGFGNNLRSLNVGDNMIKHNQLEHLTKHIASFQLHALKLSIECDRYLKKTVEYASMEQLFKFKANDIMDFIIQSTFLARNQKIYEKLTNNKLRPSNYVSVFRLRPTKA